MLDLAYPVANLQPAPYNPRAIDAAARALLRESILQFGVVKPIIATRDGLIVAGHQRTQALIDLNISHAPVYLVDRVNPADEIRFNQLHNGTEGDGVVVAHIPPGDDEGFVDIPPDSIAVDMRVPGAELRKIIADLILRYGPWGAAVASQDGAVIHGIPYLIACKALNIPCRVYRLAQAKAAMAKALLNRSYGEFAYDHLPRTPWLQTFAQPFRLRGGSQERGGSTYERLVIPNLRPGERILDFGCGQGDYVRALQQRGWHIRGVEFFPRAGNQIDTHLVHQMCAVLADDLTRYGRYDVVVCDYVLNSTDSEQAEADVLVCLNTFCKPGGRIYLTGRSRERGLPGERATKQKRDVRELQCFDAYGRSALYHRGGWFYQKYHTLEQVRGQIANYLSSDTPTIKLKALTWSAVVHKSFEVEPARVGEAIAREFNLDWPNGRTVNRADLVWDAWNVAMQRERLQAIPRLEAEKQD
jgi:ParB family chromosome partitioning protein